MISADLIKFLTQLSKNNSKEWFDKNRPRYTELRENFILFVEKIILRASQIDTDLKHLSAKQCMFRINRDIRFSPNKQPYKTNFGAELSREGRRSRYASYYIHIEPGECFVGGGIYMPEPDVLKMIRKEIYYNTDEFKKILNNNNFKKILGELETIEKLKKLPQGFSDDFKDPELLKHKHYIVGRSVSDSHISTSKFEDTVAETFKAMYPFNRFLNSAIELGASE